MTVIEALILGIIQGLTEFLPISSSGHMVIAQRIMGISSSSLEFELVTHLGTLLAVVLVYRCTLWELVKRPLSRPVRLLVVASIPTVIIVFLFQNIFRAAFDGRFLSFCFIATAILLFVASGKKQRTLRGGPKKNISYFDAVVIGAVQGLAAFPGISRSGSTISTGMLLGNDQKESARFSFLMSIPIIIGSSVVEFASGGALVGMGFLPLFVGFVASFVFGFLAIKLFLRIMANTGFEGFAMYLIFLAVFLLINDNILFLF